MSDRTSMGYGNDSLNSRHKPYCGKFHALSAVKSGSKPDSGIRIPLGSTFDGLRFSCIDTKASGSRSGC